MNAKAVAGSGGTVILDDNHAIYVEAVAFHQEIALFEDLRKLAKVQMGDYLRPVEAMLNRLAADKSAQSAARQSQILETVARMEARQELPSEDAAESARRTPAGVARELWHRSRRLHPSLKVEEFEAVITSVNAEQIHWQIREALGVKDDSKS